ncbi:HAD family hydrolase [Heliobacterium chlorum]|uniref:HAD family hydrolase n=1 Tax=Heliobacterium chlorum TaxID=2698 RepID=UPI00311AB3A1
MDLSLHKDAVKKDLSRYGLLLFDLDGTLTDPKIGITKSVQYALRKYGIVEENLDNLVKFIGPPLIDSFMEFAHFDEATARQAVEYYREYFSVYGLYENALFPQIPELLAGLKQSGKELLVATSKPTVFAEKILEHFHIGVYFSAVIGSNLDGTRCAKDEVIEYALSIAGQGNDSSVYAKGGGRPFGNALMIGDRKHDIIGAQKNNIDSVAVTYGYGSLEELEKAKPTYMVHSVDELIACFLRANV